MTDRFRRSTLLFFGIFAWLLILFAWYYLEKTLYLAPCPLCIMQRVAFALVGFFFIMEAIFWPRNSLAKIILRIGKYLSIFFGIGLAARQIYIQSLPADQVPACGFDFWGTLSSNGFWQGILTSMQGTGDCAQVHLFLGLGITKWSMIAFIILLIIAVLFGQAKKNNDIS